MAARRALAALAIFGVVLASTADGKARPAKRPPAPKQRDAALYRHDGYFGALAPENLNAPRPRAPFDLTGTWFIDSSGGFNPFTFGPPYPELVSKTRNRQQEAAAASYRNNLGKCAPPGLPMIMTRLAPVTLIQLPTAIYMMAGSASSFRTIYLDGRRRAVSKPTYNGQSIGQWEGDTLVVTTRGFEPRRHWIDSFIPISSEFQIVERIRMLAGGRSLEIQFVMTDPKIWKGEWRSTKRWNRQDRSDVVEDACVEARDAQLPGTGRGQQALDDRARRERAARTKSARAEPVAGTPAARAPAPALALAPVLEESPPEQLARAEPPPPVPAAKQRASRRAASPPVPPPKEVLAPTPQPEATPAKQLARAEPPPPPPAAKQRTSRRATPSSNDVAAKSPSIGAPESPSDDEAAAKQLAVEQSSPPPAEIGAKQLAPAAPAPSAEERPAKSLPSRALRRIFGSEPAKPPAASPTPPVVVERPAPAFAERPPVATPALRPPAAPHRLASFDQAATISLKGWFVALRAADPHGWLEIEVANTRGVLELWSIEVDTSDDRVRRAWQHISLNSGDQIIAVINPLRDGERGGLLRAVLMPDGRVVDLARPANDRPINAPPLN